MKFTPGTSELIFLPLLSIKLWVNDHTEWLLVMLHIYNEKNIYYKAKRKVSVSGHRPVSFFLW